MNIEEERLSDLWYADGAAATTEIVEDMNHVKCNERRKSNVQSQDISRKNKFITDTDNGQHENRQDRRR